MGNDTCPKCGWSIEARDNEMLNRDGEYQHIMCPDLPKNHRDSL